MSFLALDTPNPQQWILIVGLLLVGIWLLKKATKKNAKEGGEKNLTIEEQVERLRQSRGMHGDLEKLMIEIEELAQRWGKRLDAKALQMDRLLEEADAKIAELKRLRGEAAELRPRDTFVREDGETRETREPRGPRDAVPTDDAPERRLRMARDEADFAPPRGAGGGMGAPRPAGATGFSGAMREPSPDPLAASVYKLADAGHAPTEIARKLNEEIGKVELILALRRA